MECFSIISVLDIRRRECVGGYRDALDVIREELGYEIVAALEEDITDTLEEMKYERDIQEEEKEEYERNCEGYRDMLLEAVEELDGVLESMENAKRINKEKLFLSLKRIRKNIWANL